MEPDLEFTFEAEIWLYPGKAAWHFVTLPDEPGGMIRMADGRVGGFGSVPSSVTIGKSQWKTSLFPDSKSGSYLLPVKSEVRKREHLAAGDRVKVTLIINP